MRGSVAVVLALLCASQGFLAPWSAEARVGCLEGLKCMFGLNNDKDDANKTAPVEGSPDAGPMVSESPVWAEIQGCLDSLQGSLGYAQLHPQVHQFIDYIRAGVPQTESLFLASRMDSPFFNQWARKVFIPGECNLVDDSIRFRADSDTCLNAYRLQDPNYRYYVNYALTQRVHLDRLLAAGQACSNARQAQYAMAQGNMNENFANGYNNYPPSAPVTPDTRDTNSGGSGIGGALAGFGAGALTGIIADEVINDLAKGADDGGDDDSDGDDTSQDGDSGDDSDDNDGGDDGGWFDEE